MTDRLNELKRHAQDLDERIRQLPKTMALGDALQAFSEFADAIANTPYEDLLAFAGMQAEGEVYGFPALLDQLRVVLWREWSGLFSPLPSPFEKASICCPFEGAFVSQSHCVAWRLREDPGCSAWALDHIEACQACPHNASSHGASHV